jgi:hypothetical protein
MKENKQISIKQSKNMLLPSQVYSHASSTVAELRSSGTGFQTIRQVCAGDPVLDSRNQK